MIRSLLALLLAAWLPAHGQVRAVRGTVTYVAAGTVFTSLGRQDGLSDSCLISVTDGGDTVAVLRVVALSSRSSSCSVLRGSRAPRPGDGVVATVGIPDTAIHHASSSRADTAPPASLEPAGPRADRAGNARRGRDGGAGMRGRIGVQYASTSYDGGFQSVSQAGLPFSAEGRLSDAGVAFDLSGVLRAERSGGGGGGNQSRIYRMALTYAPSGGSITGGRFVQPALGSQGSVDGLSLNKSIDRFTLGLVAGFRPSVSLRGISTEFRTVAVDAAYEAPGPARVTASSAYVRTYRGSDLEREAAAAQLFVSDSRFSLSAAGEADMRRKSGKSLVYSPSLTSASVSSALPLGERVSLFLGGDASRPVAGFSAVREIPDSLLDTRLRWGASAGIGVHAARGFDLRTTVSPRSSESGFGRDFSHSSSMTLSNILSTGLTLRTTYTSALSRGTRSGVAGLSVRRSLGDLGDLAAYVQMNRTTAQSTGSQFVSRTAGANVLILMGSAVSLALDLSAVRGSAVQSVTVFGEVSYRF